MEWSPARGRSSRASTKLPPAHVLAVHPGAFTAPARRYWRLRIEPDFGPTVEEWQEAIRAKLAETTRLHLIADVPVGAFLSGGIDSSLIVALTAGMTREPLRTFSMGFADERYSELPFAARLPTSSAPSTPRRSSRRTPRA